MNSEKVIMVVLRRPRRGNAAERRSDPFYEFGSFGCTGCHGKNLMNPKRAHELEGASIAFAQGGDLGFRLVLVTPPVRVRRRGDRVELLWSPAEMPFKYACAPLLVDKDGESDFPSLRREYRAVLRTTTVGKFTSAFRSRRRAMRAETAEEVVRVYAEQRRMASPDAIAGHYWDALPYPPANRDTNRRDTLRNLRAVAMAAKGSTNGTKNLCTACPSSKTSTGTPPP